MANQWFKFYGGDYLADPKVGTLSAQERSCWVTLLSMASISTTPGVIEFLTVEVLLEKSGIVFDPYSPEEWDKCLGVFTKFERLKMLKANESGCIEIVNWNKRQEHIMSATERSRKFRIKQGGNKHYATEATKCNENATLEENRIDKNREEKRRDCVARAPQPTTENTELGTGESKGYPPKEAPFDWTTYQEDMSKKSRALKILVLFMKIKRKVPESKEEVRAFIKRHIKAATQVAVFKKDSVLKEAFEKCTELVDNNGKPIEWTLETVLKMLTK